MDAKKCRDSAIRLLTRREYSIKELRQKLSTKAFDESDISKVIADLVQERLVSDERFAESYVRSKVSRGIGPVRLRQELREHGVEEELIDRFLADQEWLQLAAGVRRKRFGQVLPESYEERAKQMRFLQYRGFSTEQINGAIKQDDWEN